MKNLAELLDVQREHHDTDASRRGSTSDNCEAVASSVSRSGQAGDTCAYMLESARNTGNERTPSRPASSGDAPCSEMASARNTDVSV
jgi:hypothetical protein